MEDQGSGVLFDLRPFGLPDEPTVAESIAAGAAVVTASGDKLLGGPQAGLICGRHDVIARLKKHPMARALRLDKMTLAALEATLFACLDETRAVREIPTLRMLTTPVAEVRAPRRGARGAHARDAAGIAAQVVCIDEIARAGGGSLPLAEIADRRGRRRARGAERRRARGAAADRGEPAIVARVKDGRLLIDPRTLLSPAEEDVVVARLGEVLGSSVARPGLGEDQVPAETSMSTLAWSPGLGECCHPVRLRQMRRDEHERRHAEQRAPLTGASTVPVSIDSMLMPRCESPCAISWMMPSWSAPTTETR